MEGPIFLSLDFVHILHIEINILHTCPIRSSTSIVKNVNKLLKKYCVLSHIFGENESAKKKNNATRLKMRVTREKVSIKKRVTRKEISRAKRAAKIFTYVSDPPTSVSDPPTSLLILTPPLHFRQFEHCINSLPVGEGCQSITCSQSINKSINQSSNQSLNQSSN